MGTKLWAAVLLVGSACGGSDSGVESPTTSAGTGESAPVVANEGADGPAGETSAGPPAVESDAELGDSSGTRFDVSAREAQRLCELEVDEEVRFERCAFGIGQDLPGGSRVDLLEFAYTEMAMVTVAMLVIRSPGDFDYPITFTLAEAQQVPGMEETYALGTMSVTGTRITLPVELISTTYPNTGDPSLPTGEYEERSRFVAQCDAMNGVYDCERVAP